MNPKVTGQPREFLHFSESAWLFLISSAMTGCQHFISRNCRMGTSLRTNSTSSNLAVSVLSGLVVVVSFDTRQH